MDRSPEYQVGILLLRSGWRVGLAESCTGGLLASRLTDVPGSSAYFVGGIVAYANEVKTQLLGVSEEILREHGAVSRETVLAMASGVRNLLGVEVGLSVSGIAGPGGESPGKPVGTVWIGLAAPGFEEAWKFAFDGDRTQNKAAAAEQGLRLLLQVLQDRE